LKRIVIFCVGIALGMATFLPAAHAFTYSISDARNYAHKWSSNYEKLRNDNYKQYEQDCANFVSQVLRAGGMPDDESGDYKWYYNTNGFLWDTHSDSWSIARHLATYLDRSGRGTVVSMAHDMDNKYTPALAGDVYAYEWGDDDGHLDHVSASSGYGDFANTDGYEGMTGGYGDYMSQHTTDRDYAPWNYGFWKQQNAITRAKMNTWLIKVNR
jgi:hypothetical protein